MSKKKVEKPYKIGGKWYLEGQVLSCHYCKYYNDGNNDEVAGGYCEYNKFRFKNDYSPGSDYSTCEHFLHNGRRPSDVGRGCLFAIIAWIIVGVVGVILLRLGIIH